MKALGEPDQVPFEQVRVSPGKAAPAPLSPPIVGGALLTLIVGGALLTGGGGRLVIELDAVSSPLAGAPYSRNSYVPGVDGIVCVQDPVWEVGPSALCVQLSA
jgi:hypothetical protein